MLNQIGFVRFILKQRLKNSHTLNVDNFLHLISFKFSYNFHLLLSIFFQSFFFFAISLMPRNCFLSLFSFSAALNCEVAS